jgi:hypothetical protein
MAAPPPSRLDAGQVLQGSFDEATGRLRTDAEATIVNADIDVQLDSVTDSVAIGDGVTGTTAAVDVSRNLAVKDVAVLSELQSQTVILGNIEAATGNLRVLNVGTIDGTPTGTPFGYVNNLRQQILTTHDRIQTITYADFGTKNQRVTQIDYNSSTFSGTTARKVITYTLIGNKYRRDSINWVIV